MKVDIAYGDISTSLDHLTFNKSLEDDKENYQKLNETKDVSICDATKEELKLMMPDATAIASSKSTTLDLNVNNGKDGKNMQFSVKHHSYQSEIVHKEVTDIGSYDTTLDQTFVEYTKDKQSTQVLVAQKYIKEQNEEVGDNTPVSTTTTNEDFEQHVVEEIPGNLNAELKSSKGFVKNFNPQSSSEYSVGTFELLHKKVINAELYDTEDEKPLHVRANEENYQEKMTQKEACGSVSLGKDEINKEVNQENLQNTFDVSNVNSIFAETALELQVNDDVKGKDELGIPEQGISESEMVDIDSSDEGMYDVSLGEFVRQTKEDELSHQKLNNQGEADDSISILDGYDNHIPKEKESLEAVNSDIAMLTDNANDQIKASQTSIDNIGFYDNFAPEQVEEAFEGSLDVGLYDVCSPTDVKDAHDTERPDGSSVGAKGKTDEHVSGLFDSVMQELLIKEQVTAESHHNSSASHHLNKAQETKPSSCNDDIYILESVEEIGFYDCKTLTKPHSSITKDSAQEKGELVADVNIHYGDDVQTKTSLPPTFDSSSFGQVAPAQISDPNTDELIDCILLNTEDKHGNIIERNFETQMSDTVVERTNDNADHVLSSQTPDIELFDPGSSQLSASFIESSELNAYNENRIAEAKEVDINLHGSTIVRNIDQTRTTDTSVDISLEHVKSSQTGSDEDNILRNEAVDIKDELDFQFSEDVADSDAVSRKPASYVPVFKDLPDDVEDCKVEKMNKYQNVYSKDNSSEKSELHANKTISEKSEVKSNSLPKDIETDSNYKEYEQKCYEKQDSSAGFMEKMVFDLSNENVVGTIAEEAAVSSELESKMLDEVQHEIVFSPVDQGDQSGFGQSMIDEACDNENDHVVEVELLLSSESPKSSEKSELHGDETISEKSEVKGNSLSKDIETESNYKEYEQKYYEKQDSSADFLEKMVFDSSNENVVDMVSEEIAVLSELEAKPLDEVQHEIVFSPVDQDDQSGFGQSMIDEACDDKNDHVVKGELLICLLLGNIRSLLCFKLKQMF